MPAAPPQYIAIHPLLANLAFIRNHPEISPCIPLGILIPPTNAQVAAIELLTPGVIRTCHDSNAQVEMTKLLSQVTYLATPHAQQQPDMAEILAEIRALRDEVRNVRNEVGTLKDEVGTLKDEVREGFTGLRRSFATRDAINQNRLRQERGKDLIAVPRERDGEVLPPRIGQHLVSRSRINKLNRNQLGRWLAFYDLPRSDDLEEQKTILACYVSGVLVD